MTDRERYPHLEILEITFSGVVITNVPVPVHGDPLTHEDGSQWLFIANIDDKLMCERVTGNKGSGGLETQTFPKEVMRFENIFWQNFLDGYKGNHKEHRYSNSAQQIHSNKGYSRGMDKRSVINSVLRYA
jgi:hypothetical protein